MGCRTAEISCPKPEGTTPVSQSDISGAFFSDYRHYRCIATASNPSSCSIQFIPPANADYITTSSSTIRISTTSSPSPNLSSLQTCQTNLPLPVKPPENSASIEIGIGAGVGIPLFVGLVASLLFLFRERRIRKQLIMEYERSNEQG